MRFRFSGVPSTGVLLPPIPPILLFLLLLLPLLLLLLPPPPPSLLNEGVPGAIGVLDAAVATPIIAPVHVPPTLPVPEARTAVLVDCFPSEPRIALRMYRGYMRCIEGI